MYNVYGIMNNSREKTGKKEIGFLYFWQNKPPDEKDLSLCRL